MSAASPASTTRSDCLYVLDEFYVMGILPLFCRNHRPAEIPLDIASDEHICALRGRSKRKPPIHLTK